MHAVTLSFRQGLKIGTGLLVFGSRVAAQAITGSVREDSTARPLSGVEVILEGTGRSVMTDAGGRYLLARLPTGGHVLLFRSVGFRPLRVRVVLAVPDTNEVNATLVPLGTQQLDPVEVKAMPAAPRGIGREAFEERRKLGFGKFIDSAEMRRSELRRTSDLLRGIPGVNMVRFRECTTSRTCGPTEERAASGRGWRSLRARNEYCWMSVILDGSPLYQDSGSRPPPDFSRDFSVASLESIEIYRSSSEVPTEYGGTSAQCGVIVLWSRRG